MKIQRAKVQRITWIRDVAWLKIWLIANWLITNVSYNKNMFGCMGLWSNMQISFKEIASKLVSNVLLTILVAGIGYLVSSMCMCIIKDGRYGLVSGIVKDQR